jgi:hypothetical protein
VPGKLTTVTIGTDGQVDYVELPTGCRYALGSMSILSLVSKLVPGQRNQRMALEAYNKEGQATVPLDVDRMFELLAPKRQTRLAGSPLIPTLERKSASFERESDASEEPIMSDPKTVLAAIDTLEMQVDYLGKLTAQGKENPAVWTDMRELSAKINLPDFGDQSKNDAFNGLGEPKVDTVEEGYTPPAEITNPKTANLEAFKGNTSVAETILTQVAETTDKIDALVTAGRKFNASKAQADLHQIASSVEEILTQTDLGSPWVGDALQKLAQQAEHIHGLFASATV